MRNIYEIFEHLEKRPAMFLGNYWGIRGLSNFISGFTCAGGRTYDSKSDHPDFWLFTGYIAAILKYKYEKPSGDWSWLLLEKYKDDRKSLEKFFYYLKKFRSAEPDVVVIQLTDDNTHYALGLTKYSKRNYNKLKKLDKIVLFKLKPSKTLFALLIDKKGKAMEHWDYDVIDKTMRKKIENQFGLEIKWEPCPVEDGKAILKKYKIL